MSITDTIFAIVCSMVGVWIIAMLLAEWINDSKLKRDMRDAGANEEEIKATFRVRAMGRSRDWP